MMNCKVWKIVWTICMYVMWFGLFLSIFIEGQVFLKLGIVMASIISPMMLRDLKESEKKNVEKK